MLLDEVSITLRAGHGGPGKVSFVPSRNQKGGPDGGNGGKGGNVIIKVTSDLTALNQFSQKRDLAAQNGEPGDRQNMSGKDGEDLVLTLPIGTYLEDESGNGLELNDLTQEILVCKGGKGGKGNFELRSSRNTTPMRAQSGLPGQGHHYKVILKLIADYGLIGLPNAGKSSLLNELTRAHARVAEYPFTTLEPNLGVLRGRILADIPGLIEGASTGKGLGIKFLKHIEKVGLIVHCISCESADPLADYETVTRELKAFNPDLLKKKEVIVLTKSDLVTEEELEKKKKALKKLKKKILTVSIYNYDSIETFKKELK
jgi:GTP-binding protein